MMIRSASRFAESTLPPALADEWPDFAGLVPDMFEAAFEAAMARHRSEIDAIAAGEGTPEERAFGGATSGGAPTFADTIGAMERSGRDLSRVASVFYALAGAHTNDALQAVE
ncbi:MAG: hypothetical protein H7Y08_04675, partial [Rhizobiaceae bacterium]|nr:hypothetical protein [Rhizobiaceae bacterium]